jgi:hypothetical protein
MNPFVAGSWVRGDLFFGREELLRGILEGNRHATWLLGMRRVGKTSVLKQLEWLALHPPHDAHYLPVYWDMQGSHDAQGLRDSLFESIEDAEESLADHGIQAASLDAEDVFRLLRNTMKAAGRTGRRLLLLCDEAEELIQVSEAEDVTLRKLRRQLMQGELIRCVLAATKRLGDVLGTRTDAGGTSPFLHGFLPPLYVSHYDEATSRRLLERGGFDPPVVAEAVARTGGHPYLLQLLGRRLHDGATLQQATEEMKADELVKAFFRVDFSYLLEAEKRVVLQAVDRGHISPSQVESESGYSGELLRSLLHSLEMIGYLRQHEGSFVIANEFFQHWLRSEHLTLRTSSTVSASPLEPLVPEHLAEGFRLGHYTIVKTLGAGGMGTVYMGMDTHLERPVALKVIHMSLAPSSTLRARFVREARTLSSLRHPGVVNVYEFDELGGTWYLVMELVEGTSLKELLATRTGPAGAVEAMRLGHEIASILAYAHGAGVIHRDIKPANIMVAPDGSVRLLDFGLAKILGEDGEPGTGGLLTGTGQILGTVAYMSPEQARGAGVGAETDQFSLGIVLYEMLTGVRPFQGQTDYTTLYQILFQEPVPLGSHRPDLAPAAAAAVERLLRKEPEQRFPAMTDAADTLRRAWEDLTAGSLSMQ